jgi:hypothetical protein
MHLARHFLHGSFAYSFRKAIKELSKQIARVVSLNLTVITCILITMMWRDEDLLKRLYDLRSIFDKNFINSDGIPAYRNHLSVFLLQSKCIQSAFIHEALVS